MKINGVSISEGNRKVGAIPSVSLLAVASCPAGVPCATSGLCYVMRNMYWRKTIREAHKGKWHVAGDILDQGYLDEMCALARQFPQTGFLAFTKMHGLDYSARPANLSVVASMWTHWGDVELVRGKGLPIAWYDDGTDDRIPADALPCGGGVREVCSLLAPGSDWV